MPAVGSTRRSVPVLQPFSPPCSGRRAAVPALDHALDTLKQTGELLRGVVIVPPSEHFGIHFGKDSRGEGDED